MEIGELEKVIIKKYVQEAIIKINQSLDFMNSNISEYTSQKDFTNIIISFLSNHSSGQGITLLIGNSSGMLEDKLSDVLKEAAIKKFLNKVNKN